MDFNDVGSEQKKLVAKELRTLQESNAAKAVASHSNTSPRLPLYFILDNVYDTYNIGGLFRLADALNISKLYICGDSETPPNHKIKKASIGTYKIVPWEYKATTLQAIHALKEDGIQIIAIEQAKQSVPYHTFEYNFPNKPIALVLGNETRGCSPEVLNQCDAIVEMPMLGLNTSLNVIVSGAIVSYHILSQSHNAS